jgi:hypothetical protein
MKKLKEGNLYNVQQVVSPQDKANQSKVGLSQWKKQVRKELMQKLRGYSPEHIDKIIKTTFNDEYIN